MIPAHFSEYFKSLDLLGHQDIVNELLLMISSATGDTSTMLSSVSEKASTLLP